MKCYAVDKAKLTTTNIAHRSQLDEVCQSFDEAAEWDRAIRDKLQEILVSIDRGADAVQNATDNIFWMICIPVINLSEKIFIKHPGLQWR